MNKPENNGFIQQIHQNYKTQVTDGIKPIPKKKTRKKKLDFTLLQWKQLPIIMQH
jgi:hypothetical protein